MRRFSLTQLKRSVERVHLTMDEKKDIRSEIVKFIVARPVRVEDGFRQRSGKGGRSPFSFLISRRMFATIAIALALLVGGGTTYAAEGSVPGDFLYPMKVRVNEEVRAALATSAEADANWDARRAERRLEEAAVLAATGRLNADAQATIEGRLQAHADRLRGRVEQLEAEGKTEEAARLSARLETALEIHSRVLADIGERQEEHQEQIRPLLHRLEVRAEEHQELRERIEARFESRAEGEVKVESQTAAERHIAAAEQKIAEVKRFIESKKTELGAEATVRAEAHLKAAEESLVSAKAAFDSDNFARAFVLAGQAHRMAQEAKLFVHVNADLDIEVRPERLLQLRARINGDVTASSSDEVRASQKSNSEENQDDDEADQPGNDSEDDKRETKGAVRGEIRIAPPPVRVNEHVRVDVGL